MKQYFIIVAAILTVLFIIGIGKTIDEGTKAGAFDWGETRGATS